MSQHVHDVVGVPDQVRAALESCRNRGELVQALPPVLLPDGRVMVRTLMAEPPRKHRKIPSGLVTGAVVAVSAAGVGLIVVAGVLAVEALISWVIANSVAIGTVAVVAIVLAVLVGGRSGCSGLHCSGCRR